MILLRTVLVLLALGSLAQAAVVKLNCGSTNSAEVTVNSVATISTVFCPKGCKANGYTVYGSGVYTSDSPICKAAIHAGIITDAGGQFKLYFAPGRSSYTATTRNGITTRSYGAWRSSFKFAGPALGPRVDCAKTNAVRDVVGVGPTLAYNRTKLTLSCPAGCLAQGGSVYGTGAYTADSRICLAAIHAGVITNSGGTFTMFDYKGLASYRGSLARNVTSRSWGSWGNSFRFKSVVDLSCGGTNNQNLLVNATATTQVAVCPANCFQAGGEVYGSAATGYRSNSLVCRAALHAGVINNNGGAVIVRWVPGLSSYKGSTANFVTSKAAAASPNAFKFL